MKESFWLGKGEGERVGDLIPHGSFLFCCSSTCMHWFHQPLISFGTSSSYYKIFKMRGQQTTLTSLLFSSLIYIFFLGSAIFYVAESAPNLTSRNVDNAATTVMTSKTKLNSDDHSKISSQASPKVLKANVCGSFCGKTFYPAIDVSEVTQRACPKILKAKNSKPSRLGGLRAHGPNLPYSYYNFPNSYTGPKEFFYAQKPLFLWPIVSNRARKIFGLKGNDRVVISVNNENKCEYQGVVRKNLFKWTKCLPGCT